MKIVLISGLSGSGKSVALRQMEDSGYFCVDNLPLEMLPSLVSYHIERADESELAVSVDVRSGIDIGQAREQIAYLRGLGHRVEVLFVEAEESVLVRRFSETRRGHPLSNQDMTLLESLKKEREWLFPLKEIAYCIDTSQMNAQQLRQAVRQWLKVERTGLLVILESFGFKYGVPNNADFMFDMRSLPNPYYDLELRAFTGTDQPVRDYLDGQPLVQEMVDDIERFVTHWLPRLEDESRSYVTVAIGCTGGQHRSVYVVEELAGRLQGRYELLIRHRQAQNLPAELSDFALHIQKILPSSELYCGSPWLAQSMARATDKLRLFELHPADFIRLQNNMNEVGLGKRGQVLREDGYKGLISLLPPPPRRAAVLIDPPYEEKQDYRRVTDTLKTALKRFESGCYLVWYPCLSREESRKLPEELKKLVPDNFLHAELHVHTPKTDGFGMYGSGMFVINPPYLLAEQLAANLPALTRLLAQDEGAHYLLDSKIR